MESFPSLDFLIWFVFPNFYFYIFNLFCKYKNVNFGLKNYLLSMSIGLVGFFFGPSCMCKEVNQKAFGLIIFVSIISFIFILMVAGKISFCKRNAAKQNSEGNADKL